MRKYFVDYYMNGANTYNVFSAEKAETIEALEEMGAERITLKKARALCARERERRKYECTGGYATDHIVDAELEHLPKPATGPDRKYFVFYGDFANTYRVCSAVKDETIKALEKLGAERITLEKARSLCARERERRKYEGNGGYASSKIEDAELELWE